MVISIKDKSWSVLCPPWLGQTTSTTQWLELQNSYPHIHTKPISFSIQNQNPQNLSRPRHHHHIHNKWLNPASPLIDGASDSILSVLKSTLTCPYYSFPFIGWNCHVETIYTVICRSFPGVKLRHECLCTKGNGSVALNWVSSEPPNTRAAWLVVGFLRRKGRCESSAMGCRQSGQYCTKDRFRSIKGTKYFGIGRYWYTVSGLSYFYKYIYLNLYLRKHKN